MPVKKALPPPDVRFEDGYAEELTQMDPNCDTIKKVSEMVDKLWEDMKAGDDIPKDRIPRYYTRKFKVNNLYRYEHPDGYRSIYSLVVVPGIGVCPTIWETLSHPEYNRRFRYRKR